MRYWVLIGLLLAVLRTGGVSAGTVEVTGRYATLKQMMSALPSSTLFYTINQADGTISQVLIVTAQSGSLLFSWDQRSSSVTEQQFLTDFPLAIRVLVINQ